MRNLKRALSLAVASVMLVGMMVVGTGASYDDVSSEHNQEAIEVLQAIGVMVGDGESFNPDQNVTREEMAVIMCNLLDYTVSSYQGLTRFTDVSDWARPYVEACYTKGIIAGYSDTQFGGADSVTTGQAGLMIMKALGYFQEMGDFGSDWLVATVSQGAQIQLFDGVDKGANGALTRNDVAQMVLNALEAQCVRISSHDLVSDGMGGFTTKAVYTARTSSDDQYAKITDETSPYNQYYTIQLGEELFGGDLEKRGSQDAFVRPSTTWRYRSSEIGTYSDSPDYTYVGKVSKGALYSDLGRSIYNNINSNDIGTANPDDGKYGVTVFVDGAPQTVTRDSLLASNSSGHITETANNSNLTGAGVQTEVYVDNTKYTVTICIINTYVMQATADYNSSRESLNVDVLTGTYGASTLDLEDFDTLSAYSEDDYILYTYADNEVQTIAKAEVVQGEVDSFTKDSVTIDGTKYDYTKTLVAYEREDTNLTTFTAGEAASIVVDAYGNLIWIDDSSLSVGNYIYVDASDTTLLGREAVAGAYTSDGVYDEITVKKVRIGNNEYTDANVIKTQLGNNNGWYSYTVDSSDRYTLTKAATGVSATYGWNDSADNKYNAQTDIVTNAAVRFLDGSTIRANSDTVFIVDDGEDILVYTGVNSAPTVTLKESEDQITVAYMKVNDDSEKSYASLVFVDAGDASVDDTSASTDLLYIIREDRKYKDASDTVYVYDAVLNGEETEVESTDELTVGGMYYRVKQDSDGRISNDSRLFTTASGGEYRYGSIVNGTVDYSSGALNVGGVDFTVAEDAQITLIMMKGCAAMRDPDANYEAASVTARGLASTLNNYAVTGTYYAVTTEDDNDELGTLYLVLSNTTADPEGEVAEKVDNSISDSNGAWGETDSGNYTAVGDWAVDADDASVVVATFTTSEATANSGENVMNDTARFLGSLQRNGGASEIVFDGVTYIWDEDEPLKGSNWYDASDNALDEGVNTLVKALVDWQAENQSATEVTLTVDNVDITIKYVMTGA